MYEQIQAWLSTQLVDNEMFIGVIAASSIELALASHMGKPTYVLNLASVAQDSVLMEAFAEVPQDATLLVEDIDAIRVARNRIDGAVQKDGTSGGSSATLSGLLHAINWVAGEGKSSASVASPLAGRTATIRVTAE